MFIVFSTRCSGGLIYNRDAHVQWIARMYEIVSMYYWASLSSFSSPILFVFSLLQSLTICLPCKQQATSTTHCPHTVSVVSSWSTCLSSQQHTNCKPLLHIHGVICHHNGGVLFWLALVLFWYPGQMTLLQCTACHFLRSDAALYWRNESAFMCPRELHILSFCTSSHLACQSKCLVILVCYITACMWCHTQLDSSTLLK